MFLIGQPTFLYVCCLALALFAYLFISLSNADVSLAKELKIEVTYENKVHVQRSAKLRNELKLLHEVMLGGVNIISDDKHHDMALDGRNNPN